MAKKEKRSRWLFISILLITILLFTIIITREQFVKEEGLLYNKPYQPGIEVPYKSLNLYFSDIKSEYLVKENRKVVGYGEELDEKVEILVRELIVGPKTELVPTIPSNTRIRGVKVKDGTAYIDFTSEFVKNHPGGSNAEIFTIYSIVDSLILNFPEIKRVQILTNGRAIETIAGHINLSKPITLNTQYIKGNGTL
ncbi:MAG: GerMN domain-containing protein [Thermodesulfobacteriota bacterium]|nr:GerMN domain-containing protein [Thermodesulfobacteriota bacterium]